MDYIPIPENAARQAIDSATIYAEWLRSKTEAKRFTGGMYFKRDGEYEYLVRTSTDNRQQRLGKRNAETEQIYGAFSGKKTAVETRARSLTHALHETERLNKALKVGRVPNLVVSLINELAAAGLDQHFTVVGTHALYAYESAASVRIQAGAMATQDVDLLWDARKRIQFSSTMEQLDSSMLKILQRADPTFKRLEGQLESVINDKGFMVDFLRRVAVETDPYPFRFTDDEGDIWPVQAQRAEAFLNAPHFEQIVISITGRMAVMRTISPDVFVKFKLWMSELASRPAGKRRRDKLQARTVQQLLDEALIYPLS